MHRRAGLPWLERCRDLVTCSAPNLPQLAGALAWLAVLSVGAASVFIVTRACGYALGAVVAYAAYFAGYVALPGIVTLAALTRGRVSLVAAIALGVPTGFALEIFTFLLLAALDAKALLPAIPVVWLAAGLLVWRRWKVMPLTCRVSPNHAGVALALSLLFLATVVTAASQMFAESPLVDGLPQRPIFHDWIYLVSRTAAIKHVWPLEDPSLAGTPLQYHYFMLVHAAAASSVTGLEVTLILLRLMIVPLGAVIVVQTYSLGRRASGSPWGGVLAAILTMAAGELAFADHPNHSVFVGRFIRWLYVSPTFYFGVIFFAAIILALERWRTLRRLRVIDGAWLCLLAAAGTGAKATVLPVLICAVTGMAAWQWARRRVFPARLATAGLCLGASFTAVYLATMAGTHSGTAFSPFDVFKVGDFWQERFPAWTAALARWMPAGAAALAATLGCAAISLAGTAGVRLLALPALLGRAPPVAAPLTLSLGLALLVSAGVGMALRMDAQSELYFFLLMRVPGSILAAAFMVQVVRQFQSRSRTPIYGWAAVHRWLRAVGIAGVAAAVLVQIGVWAARNRGRWAEWTEAPAVGRVQEDLRLLEDAARWIRRETEPDAVLITNVCTTATLRSDHWGAVDGTLAGVHYYYSALAERRMLVEGPNYLMDGNIAAERLALAEAIFHGRPAPAMPLLGDAPVYLVVDRRIQTDRPIALARRTRAFGNARVEVYRVPRGGLSNASD